MAETRGLIIEIGADTSKMNKALREIGRPLGKIQSELRFIDEGLKLNPKNVQLLSQKFKVMQNAITASDAKIGQLRKELANLRANNAPEEQIRRLEREIISAEGEARKLRREFELFKASQTTLGRMGTTLQGVGNKLTNAGNKLRGVSIATGLVGGMAIRTTAEFDTAMSKVQAISGATGSQFDALRNKAREMGEITKFSATESAEALSYMAMAGWKTEDMLAGLEGIMNLASASGEDLATTSDIVTDALTAFGLSAKDAGMFADVLASTSANANTNVSMMGESFKYVGPVAGALGYSIQDISLALGLMANSQIKATQAGTSLRSIISRMASPTGQVASAMKELNVEFENSDGTARPFGAVIEDLRTSMAGLTDTEKTQYASTIAGRNAMSGFLAIINSSDKDFNKLKDAIANSNGSAQEMSEIMQDNLGGQLTKLKSQLTELSISMGDTLTPIVKKAVSVLRTIVDAFNKMPEGVKRAITLFMGLVAISGPVLMVFGAIASGIGHVMTVVSKLGAPLAKTTGFFARFGTMGNVITKFLGPIGLAITAFTLMWQNSESFRTSMTQLMQVLGGSVMQVLQALAPFLQTAGMAIGKIATTLGNILAPAIEMLLPWITLLLNAFTKLATGVISKMTSMLSVLTGVFTKVGNALVTPITNAKNRVKGIIDSIKKFFPVKIGHLLKGVKLPKFDLKWGSKDFGKLGTLRYPKGLKISWKAKGAILDNPTLIGAGEAGREGVIPLSGRAMQPFASAIAQNMGINYDAMAQAMVNALMAVNAPVIIQVDGKTIATTTAPYMNSAINTINARQARQRGVV